MFCEKCGKELKAGDAFCWACGAPIPDTGDIEEEVEKNIAESVTSMHTGAQRASQISDELADKSQKIETKINDVQSVEETNSSEQAKSVDEAYGGMESSYRNVSSGANNSMNVDPKILSGQVSSKFKYNRENNSTAITFKIVGWAIIVIGFIIGIMVMIAAASTGKSSSYMSSLFSGLGAGSGILIMVISVLSSLGFFGMAEIIQLLQDQKTILLRQNLHNNEK